MVEYAREATVEVVIDTNKTTWRKKFNIDDYENLSELMQAVEEYVDNIYAGFN